MIRNVSAGKKEKDIPGQNLCSEPFDESAGQEKKSSICFTLIHKFS